jgi:hypothetical protein
MSESAASTARRDPLPAGVAKLLDNPIAGLAPWIVYALVEGPGRLEAAAVSAFALAAIVLVLSLIRGQSPKLLEYSDVVFFGALGLVVAFASDSTHGWLENWSGEVANIALAAIVIGSMLVRRPFTMQYAKENVDPSLWKTPGFIRTNYVITGVWAVAFLVQAAAGWYADGVLHDSNNIWLSWVLETAAIIVAIQFTLWYPGVVRARAQGTEPPSLALFFAPLTAWLTVIGIISLSANAAPDWVGYVFIAAGIIAGKAVHGVLRDGDGGAPERAAAG